MSETTTAIVPPSREQSDALKAIWEAIGRAVQSATHLQVVTILGNASVDTVNGLSEVVVTLPASSPEAGYSVLATNINLALGDIAQTFSPALLDGSHDNLLVLHQQMLDKGQTIVRDNLELLKSLVKELRASG
ncbi:hypothetical protein GCM10011504_09480 [Siccirubricoccus deserti]|uniref:Uncharacterized protein n=1 Tax=Siccirubricoccus deserti TaxID=2013562 RepID=A0A9X0QVU8_9PROT|nr:hypothetical protein [Siccirubricoccus deserti]MBC4014377.1 hypothetical protein [Siccirubricoccus deserti]GGC33327.1 hypothetical protein GCM10011504_09480 [Siccirubricoccus deserti]